MFAKKSPLAIAITMAAGLSAVNGYAQSETEEATDSGLLDEIVIVTSYRKAQQAALELKRNSANNVSTIIAEDIGKMPDLNLAESLQRSPGVAISREGGEGRQITVRGLGPEYTRVTLNGMEVPASSGGLDSSGGVNRGRSFDFNIFSADMFRQITINKNAIAHIEEGGFASTVELFTLRPLDKPGFNATGSLQSAYNIHTEENDPRFNGLISNTFMDDKIGVLLGVNYTERTVHQEGFGTVRWTGPASNLRGSDPAGWGWADTSSTVINGTPNPDANYPGNDGSLAPLDYMWAPRLPRMDSFNHDQKRQGMLLSLQAQPTDQLEITFNHLRTKRDSDVKSYNYFAQFRNLHNSITPNEVTLDPSGRYIAAGSFSNVFTRSESRGQFGETEFDQTVLSAKYDFNDSLSLDVMYGEATSEHAEEQYRYNMTSNAGYDFSYSFLSDSDIAEMSYGFDITDPDNYVFTGPVHRQNLVKRENTTFKIDLTWEFDDNGSNLMGGIILTERSIGSRFTDATVGLTTPNTPSAANTNLLSSEVSRYGEGIDGPSGFPTNWLVADFDVVRREYNAGTWEAEPLDSRSYTVSEDTEGMYIEANYRLGDQWWFNGGLRYVETTVQGNKGTGEEQSYDNVLPSLNVTFEPIENLLFRASFSENIARPNPADISGAINFEPINGNVTIDNPGLKPEKAESLDFAVEWYFADESFVGITFFEKDITDSIGEFTTESTALPASVVDIVAADPVYDPSSPAFDASVIQPNDPDGWNVTESTNSSESAKLDGYEIAVNHVFPIGIGVFANYNHVEGDETLIEGLSEDSYNYGIFYEDDTFGARLVVNDRDDYITDTTGSNGNVAHATTGPTRVDFSGSYNINDNFTLTLEVINLTNEKERLYTTGPEGDLNLVREYNTTGTEVLFGVRASF